MIVRFLPFDDAIKVARVILAVNFISFCLRLLQIFSVHKKMGPKIVMIQKMLEDLMYFIMILMVFVVSYAIASHSILYPNSPLTWQTVIQVIRMSYWNIYGELFLDDIEGDSGCTFNEILWGNGTYLRCPSELGKVVVPILMGVYMLVVSVLLLNLLVAMFSNTFANVHTETEKYWCFHRYSLINEYLTRPVLCPPFVVLYPLLLLVRYICCKRGNDQDRKNYFKRKLKNTEHERELIQWENVIAYEYQQKLSENLDIKVDISNEILSRIELQQEKMQSSHLAMQDQIKWIVDTLRKSHTAQTRGKVSGAIQRDPEEMSC
ncbi:transient receptor potential cation channel subfamily M member-like 2 isoform X2 [Dreissena polymorpha]|nr:transient receptor potential cation channel subfamily M member-like 2 isoform X2 [Dreissena polymorpha]XP_052244282.1 transient receptor potential cation channel subfamily M member-like 2 isoform X2 [Dreissena polymorpha]